VAFVTLFYADLLGGLWLGLVGGLLLLWRIAVAEKRNE
jgi:hypothetical protein